MWAAPKPHRDRWPLEKASTLFSRRLKLDQTGSSLSSHLTTVCHLTIACSAVRVNM